MSSFAVRRYLKRADFTFFNDSLFNNTADWLSRENLPAGLNHRVHIGHAHVFL
jgi:hypothetical protein